MTWIDAVQMLWVPAMVVVGLCLASPWYGYQAGDLDRFRGERR